MSLHRTALLKVHNNISLNSDNEKVTALTLLDRAAAFDNTDHNIFIKRLPPCYGISGTALRWFYSYLTDRRQAIKIGSCFSDMLPTSCGVRNGSALELLLFICCSLNQPRDCLHDVSLWMNNSNLKHTANKTDFPIIGTPTQKENLMAFSGHINK